ncbi:Transmembrane protein [Schistosoma japonicum]|nr:Transmembrane protein [Schistosoma japonicum]
MRPVSGGLNNSTRRTYEQLTSSTPLVKHYTFPAVPKLSRTSFLLLSLLLCLLSTLTQHVNLYKTVWWLPNSSVEYAIEFSLIDYHVVAHTICMLCTPYIYLLLIQLVPSFVMASLMIRSVLGLFIFTSWGYTMIWILNRVEYSGTTILCRFIKLRLSATCFVINFNKSASKIFVRRICPRLIVRILDAKSILNTSLSPVYPRPIPIITCLVYHCWHFEELVYRDSRHQQPNGDDNSDNNYYSVRNARVMCQPVFSATGFLQLLSSTCWRCLTIITDWPCLPLKNIFFPIPFTFVPSGHTHTSSNNSSVSFDCYTTDLNPNNFLINHQCLGVTSEQIREEVELYRRDFNGRLMDILIGTLHAVYYACFLPIIFVQNKHLHTDFWWCLQHCFLTGLVVFLLRWHYFLPCDYIDLLHRSSMHLGSWETLPLQSGYTNATLWSACTNKKGMVFFSCFHK